VVSLELPSVPSPHGHHYPDPSHGIWGDVLLTIKDAGLYHFCLLMTSVFTWHLGPWQDSKFFRELQESSKEYLDNASPDHDALFVSQLCAMLRDMQVGRQSGRGGHQH
jgi:hypothetical protein